ncbi:phage tail tape measure protein, TP901 family, core region [Myroides odoratimimus CCUG 3837]|uniref:phage tail tape measure protein n=1 Tax=Myroides odoratimimus TaxID=76832 RepID=UPI000280AC3E|nr:phage tail tape measure protein [Myroides odoratimimus]EKB02650.1 phage tail tape measure protein, TP901 family, core region [Myroides odoratimimus CCUG 3837]
MSTVTRNIHISINGQEVVNSLTGIRGAIRNTERDIRNLNRNDKDYQETLRQHQQRLASLREEYTRARGELSQTPSVLQRIKAELGDVATGMLKAFTVTALIGTFVNGIKSAFNIIVEFDQAQADLAGILETNKAGVAALTYEAIKLGARLPFTSTEVSKAQLELAKLGKSIDEIINMTPGVLNAAIAMDTDLASAAEFVAGQLNSFAEGSSQASKYADIMSNSTNISATSFEYLATSIPKVSKVASVANVSFEKLNATIGVLADQNIAAETAGTGFRNILLTASKEGVHYEQLLQKVKGSTDQLSTATELFGKENATVAVVLANSTEKIIAQTTALENSSGSAEKLAKEKMNSLEGDMKLFDSAMEGFVLSIEKGDGFLGKLTRSVVQLGTSFIDLITPTRRVSDELFDQQIELNKLINKITSSNIENEERLRLLKELQDKYPEYISKIDIETVSNQELLDVLQHINSNYRERIRLQLQVEKADKLRDSRNSLTEKALKVEDTLEEELIKAKDKYKITIAIDKGNIEKSAREVMAAMKKAGAYTGSLGGAYHNIEALLNKRSSLIRLEDELNEKLEVQSNKISEITKETGILTETEKDRIAEEAANLKLKTEQAKKLGGKEGTDFKKDDIKSIQEYIKAKQLELDIENQSTNRKKELSDKEQKIAQRKKERDEEIFKAGEKAIDDLLTQSINNREVALLKGIDRDIKAIELKYAKDIEKFKEHSDRKEAIETARDAEIAQIKLLKAKEYQDQITALEDEAVIRKRENELQRYADGIVDENERALAMLEKTREINDMELELQMDKEIAKIEQTENSEALITAIKQKYATQKEGISISLADKEKQIAEAKAKKEREIENQKLDVFKNALNSTSELFNQGTGAWKAAKVAETTISTYQAAQNVYQSVSDIPVIGWTMAPIMAGLAVASGLKNVQKIMTTKVPEMPTYFYGGYTSGTPQNLGGDKYGEFTGMTHANEWVMPAIMTQSPRYADTLTWLENERKYGPTSNPPGGDNRAMIEASMLLAAATNQLTETLANGLSANVSIGYKETMKIDALNKEITQSQHNSNI